MDKVLKPEDRERYERMKLKPAQVKDLVCSFCGKHRDEVAQMIAGPEASVAICDECVRLCCEIVDAAGSAS